MAAAMSKNFSFPHEEHLQIQRQVLLFDAWELGGALEKSTAMGVTPTLSGQ